jgi:hypothetical protein
MILGGNFEGKRLLGHDSVDGEIMLRRDLKKMWSELVKWIELAQCAYTPVPSLVARYNSSLCTWRKSSAVTINHV